jgi:hypothetical protein
MGKIEGIRICQHAPRVNHLFFADDSLILMMAGVSGAQELLHILEVYQRASGQVINKDKSYIMFSPNISQRVKIQMKSNLSIDLEARGEKYLGLPVSVGISRKRPLSTLRRNYGAEFRVDKRSSFPRLGERDSSESCCTIDPFLLMPCHVSTLLKDFVLS